MLQPTQWTINEVRVQLVWFRKNLLMPRVGAQDSNLFLAGFQLESCEEHSPSNLDPVLLSKIETLKNRRN
jgi:hypothetical protein